MRLIARTVVALVTSCVALLVAAVLLDDFRISAVTFPVVVCVFSLILLVTRAALETMIDKNAQWASSFVGLIAAFVTLLITDLVSDGLDIEGAGTWILATLIVWLGAVLTNLLLARRLMNRMLGERAGRARG